MSVPATRADNSPTPGDDDNRFDAVQQKITALARTMDSATAALGHLYTGMRSNGERAHSAAERIAQAELEPLFVEMTNTVSVALGGAAAAVKKVQATAHDVAEQAHEAQATHSKLYSGLHEVRSNRPARPPKPGFLIH